MVGAYFIRRVFRIFPLYITVLIVLLLLQMMTFGEVIDHLLLQKGKFVLWAIPVEFKYYLVIPIICLLIVNLSANSARVILAIGALCGVAYTVPLQARIFSNTIELLTYISIFLIGSLCALSFQRLASPKIRALLLLVSLGGVCIATLGHQAWILHQVKNALAPWISLLMAVSWAGVILFGSAVALFHQACSSRVAVFFGEISFSLYLLHAIILAFFRGVHPLPEYLMGPAILLLTIAVSVVTYYLIEKPGMRLGKILSAKVRQWRAPA
jgi:peptidoglycan/LPS O-acetylase OafA/YrhL